MRTEIAAERDSNLTFKTIDWLRFPLVVCVIIIHSFGYPEKIAVQEIDLSALTGMDAYNIFRIIIREIAATANFAFFLISGYLFFVKDETWNVKVYVGKLRKRLSSLVVPYVIWNLVNVSIPFVVIVGGRILKGDGEWKRLLSTFHSIEERGLLNVFWHYHTWGEKTNIFGWAQPCMGPFSVPLWFVQTLIVLAILSPLIYLACSHLKIYGIILLGLLYWTGIWVSVPGFGIDAIFFFSLGAFFGIHKIDLIAVSRKYNHIWVAISALTILPSGYLDFDGATYNYFSPIFIFAMIFCLLSTVSYFAQTTESLLLRKLSQASFFVYAIHTVLILQNIEDTFNTLLESTNPAILAAKYISIPIVTAFVCAAIYFAMKRISPPLLGLLSGNR